MKIPFFKKKEPITADVAPTPAPTQPTPLRVSHMAAISSRQRAAAPPVFSPAAPPPGVPSTVPTLAMDGQIEASSAWANSMAAAFWEEGVTFLGYPLLAQLAQRPEYRVISETIAQEMTREWIEFYSKADDDEDDKSERIKEIEAEFNRLNVVGAFRKATEQDGYFGRGHIYVDTGATAQPEELTKSIGDGWDKMSQTKMRKKPITALRTVEAVWCYPTSYNSNDPLTDDWYRPNSWFVQSKEVHSSRLITIIGREVPDLLKPTYSFGGLSLSQMAKPYVDNWLQTRQSVNDIISAFSVFVLSTNLATSVQGDGQQLFDRADLFNNIRDNRGLMIIDKDQEEFQNVSASLAGLEALQAQAQEHMASVSHIPTVKLLGIQPAGLNASSEDQMRVFYDYIHSYQEKIYRAPLHRLLGLVMLSLWGEVDEDIDFRFKPLFSMTEHEEAEIQKFRAEADAMRIDSGVVSPEEVRQKVANDPASGFSSLDVDDVPDLAEEEAEGLEPRGQRGAEDEATSARLALDRLFKAK